MLVIFVILVLAASGIVFILSIASGVEMVLGITAILMIVGILVLSRRFTSEDSYAGLDVRRPKR